MIREILAVTNDKGGVGKTTTVVNTAVALSRIKSYKVLVIDADSQRNASSALGWDPQREEQGDRTLFDAMSSVSSLPVYESETGVYYTPCSKKIVEISKWLNITMQPKKVLEECMKLELHTYYDEGPQFIRDFDYVLIDCPPSLGDVTLNAMAAATSIIIPVQMEPFSISGLEEISVKFLEVKRYLNPWLTVRGYLIVQYQPSLRMTRKYEELMNENLREMVFSQRIRKSVSVSMSQDEAGNVFDYKRYSDGAIDYERFATELETTMPQQKAGLKRYINVEEN